VTGKLRTAVDLETLGFVIFIPTSMFLFN